jgi:hypothetical protein
MPVAGRKPRKEFIPVMHFAFWAELFYTIIIEFKSYKEVFKQ